METETRTSDIRGTAWEELDQLRATIAELREELLTLQKKHLNKLLEHDEQDATIAELRAVIDGKEAALSVAGKEIERLREIQRFRITDGNKDEETVFCRIGGSSLPRRGCLHRIWDASMNRLGILGRAEVVFNLRFQRLTESEASPCDS